MLSEKLGKNIRKHRLSRKWTQERLGELLMVSCQAVSKWENGIAMPDVQMLYTLAQLFHITLDELCGIKPDTTTAVLQQVRENCPCDEKASYDVLNGKWQIILGQIVMYPSNEELLVYALRYLRLMHDRIETDEQKETVNGQILMIAQRILDFSCNDRNRSLANYNLAVYYDEQVQPLRANEEDKRNAEKAKEHAGLVLYKDMSQTLYNIFGAVTVNEGLAAQELTLRESVEVTKRAAGNVLRRYEFMRKTAESFDERKYQDVKEFLGQLEQARTMLVKAF